MKSNTSFQQANKAAIAQLEADKQHVIATVQTVKGTAYQKTFARIIEAVANGNQNITVVTNVNNPEMENLETLIKQSNLALNKATVTLKPL